MTDAQRKQAFAASVAFLALVVVGLSLLDGKDRRERPERPSVSRTPAESAATAPIPEATTSAPTPGPTTDDPDPAPLPDDPDPAPVPDNPYPAPVPDDERSTRSERLVLPAGQAPEPGSRAAPARSDGPAPPVAVRALAEQFVRAYLVYELGRAAPAERRVLARSTSGALRRELLRDPPRAPLGAPLRRARLSSIDGIAARGPLRYDVTYTVRRGAGYEVHAIEVAREAGRWSVTSLLG